MNSLSLLKKHIAASVAGLFLFSISVVPDTQAMLAPAPNAPAVQGNESARAEDAAQVQAFLENKIVRQRLADMGMSEADINRRLASLTDAEMKQVAAHIQREAPAGDIGVGGVLVVVVLVLLIIFLAKRI
jgi:hypothetical protein